MLPVLSMAPRALHWSLAAFLLLTASGARADAPVAAADQDAELLHRVLQANASNARARRQLSAALDLTVAVFTVPPGIALVVRSDPASQIAGTALLLRGGLDLWNLTSDLSPWRSESLLRHYEDRRARGETAAQASEETEREWADGVRRDRHSEVVWGTVGLVEGGLVTAGGIYLMIASPFVSSWNRQEQTAIGLVATVAGLHDFTLGSWTLFGPSGDLLLDLYRLSKPPAAPSSPSPMEGSPVTVGVVPTIGGAMGSVRGVF
jgi:hypothetical protein